ncbi:hypothetical protein KIPB_010739, partial [Kipferlia bialata]
CMCEVGPQRVLFVCETREDYSCALGASDTEEESETIGTDTLDDGDPTHNTVIVTFDSDLAVTDTEWFCLDIGRLQLHDQCVDVSLSAWLVDGYVVLVARYYFGQSFSKSRYHVFRLSLDTLEVEQMPPQMAHVATSYSTTDGCSLSHTTGTGGIISEWTGNPRQFRMGDRLFFIGECKTILYQEPQLVLLTLCPSTASWEVLQPPPETLRRELHAMQESKSLVPPSVVGDTAYFWRRSAKSALR